MNAIRIEQKILFIIRKMMESGNNLRTLRGGR